MKAVRDFSTRAVSIKVDILNRNPIVAHAAKLNNIVVVPERIPTAPESAETVTRIAYRFRRIGIAGE